MKYLILLVVICLIHRGCTREGKENKTFVATKEWQEISEGEGIPAGLHVRINLQTGKKEAKILDGESNDKKAEKNKNAALSVVPENSKEDLAESNAKKQKAKLLDEALQRIYIDNTPREKVDNILHENKSYEELKKSFKGMRKSLKTDSEIIQLIEEFRNSANSNENKNAASRLKTQIQILESFNYLMSDYDNPLVFINEHGLEHVILPVLVNTTQTQLKVEAMRVLGAMSQNNPIVQIRIFERNVGSYLAQIIMTSTNTEELSAALYAFSSLLRKYPLAQQRILSTSGTQALMSVLNRDCGLKIKIKVIVLIDDLLEEKKNVLTHQSHVRLAVAEYAEIRLSTWLMDHNYCELMKNIIKDYAHRFLVTPDFLEYIIYSLSNGTDLCLNNWQQDTRIVEILQMLKKGLSQSLDEYHVEVAQLLDKFLRNTYGDSDKNHDEL